MLRKASFAPVVALGLAVSGPAAAQDYAIFGVSLFDDLVPTGGKDGASADFNAEFDFVEGRICYYLEIAGLPDADGAAIHRGQRDGSGAQMVVLPLPDPPDDEVCVDVDPALLQRMSDNADDYYVMVSSPDFPGGAMRGQLAD